MPYSGALNRPVARGVESDTVEERAFSFLRINRRAAAGFRLR